MSEDLRQAREEVKQYREENKKLTERVDSLEDDLRTKRFTEIVTNGNRWFGKVGDNVKMLKSMAEKFGEDSEEFKAFVEREEIHAKQLAESALFRVEGGDRGSDADGATANEKLEAIAGEIQQKEPEKFSDFNDAYVEASRRNPALVQEHRRQFKEVQ
jgi:hypothetical protein